MRNGKPSTADIGDRHRTMDALAALALACFFAASAAEQVSPPGVAVLLHWTALAMVAVAVLLVLPIVAWKLRSRGRAAWDRYRGRDGFVREIVARAQMISWGATFFVLVALSRLENRLEGLPPGFLFEAVLALMLAIFAVSFLVLDRSESREASGD
jgi:hypothetical protein